jgi:hypothetical protein
MMNAPECRYCVAALVAADAVGFLSPATTVATDDQGRPIFLCVAHASRLISIEKLSGGALSSISDIPILNTFSWQIDHSEGTKPPFAERAT